MTPLVTVGLPVYNAEAYLEKCLESILTQTQPDFTLLAILDGPHERCLRILESKQDSRLKLIVNPVNLGITKTANLLLENTTTPYFARMDADDIMKPDRLACQLDYLESHPECDILGTHFEYINVRGELAGYEPDWPTTHDEIYERFRFHNPIANPTVMFRTAAIHGIGGYDEKYRNAEDLALWLKALAHGLQFANLPDKLLYYRRHVSQATQARMESDLSFCDRAYAEFGRQIWGDRAPDYVAGKTRWHRLRRRFKRNITRLFTK